MVLLEADIADAMTQMPSDDFPAGESDEEDEGSDDDRPLMELAKALEVKPRAEAPPLLEVPALEVKPGYDAPSPKVEVEPATVSARGSSYLIAEPAVAQVSDVVADAAPDESSDAEATRATKRAKYLKYKGLIKCNLCGCDIQKANVREHQTSRKCKTRATKMAGA